MVYLWMKKRLGLRSSLRNYFRLQCRFGLEGGQEGFHGSWNFTNPIVQKLSVLIFRVRVPVLLQIMTWFLVLHVIRTTSENKLCVMCEQTRDLQGIMGSGEQFGILIHLSNISFSQILEHAFLCYSPPTDIQLLCYVSFDAFLFFIRLLFLINLQNHSFLHIWRVCWTDILALWEAAMYGFNCWYRNQPVNDYLWHGFLWLFSITSSFNREIVASTKTDFFHLKKFSSIRISHFPLK